MEKPQGEAQEPMTEPEAAAEMDESNVAPEEQELYDVVVVTAQAYLYSPGATKMVVEKIKSMEPEKGLPYAIGHTCAMILLSLKGAREKQKMPPIPGDVMYAAGAEVIAELLVIADRAGLAKEDDAELFKQAAFEAAKIYGETELKSGAVTPEDQQDAKGQIDRIKSEYAKMSGGKRGIIEQGMENGNG